MSRSWRPSARCMRNARVRGLRRGVCIVLQYFRMLFALYGLILVESECMYVRRKMKNSQSGLNCTPTRYAYGWRRDRYDDDTLERQTHTYKLTSESKRKKTDTPSTLQVLQDNTREGWEDGTPPPHRDFEERSVVIAVNHPWASASSYLCAKILYSVGCKTRWDPDASTHGYI